MKKEEIKNCVANAMTEMQGCKFLLCTMIDEKRRIVNFHQECSTMDVFTFIKGILSRDDVLMKNTLAWLTDRIREDIEKELKKM